MSIRSNTMSRKYYESRNSGYKKPQTYSYQRWKRARTELNLKSDLTHMNDRKIYLTKTA